jgi:NAD(P)-dependent dehydrogenase (short-subunit alcohol dehydrogenase family)
MVARMAEAASTGPPDQAHGGEALFIPVAVAHGGAVEVLMGTIVETYGRLDYAPTNAGIVSVRRLTHESAGVVWDRVIAINSKCVWLCSAAPRVVSGLVMPVDRGRSAG